MRRWAALGLGAALLCLLAAAPRVVWAQHFDVELRTSAGPVAGSQITTHLFGDISVTGPLPVDALTGYKIFWGYFGDLEGGPYLTDDPGFQAFRNTFLRREEIHFRVLGSLLYWSPATGRWGPAATGTKVALFGGIPIEVIVGYTENPALWQAQYDYWAGGSRFTAQGVEGPPTAVIDDAGASGAFHAHLDWKITATGNGAPAAGAYLVTLELFSTALHNGAPKYLPSAPIHIVFERGISEAQLQAAIQARVTPPPPPSCGAASLSWTVGGVGCSGAVNDTNTGVTVTVRDLVEPTLGSAQFTCQAGQWSGASQASCAVPPPPPPPCAQSLLSWTVAGTSCQALAPSTASGLSVALADNVEPNLGSASFTCTAGQWGAPAQAVCTPPPPPRPCTTQTLGWQVAGLSCSASAQGTASGNSVSAVDTDGPQVGSAVFACTNGSWGAPQAASCSTLPPAGCSAAVLPWTQNGQSCSAAVPATASGGVASAVDSEAPATGSAQFTCSNGGWSNAMAAICQVPPPPPPATCAQSLLSWTVAGTSCQAQAPGTASGLTVALADSVEPNLGSASFACTAGQWSAPAQAVCNPPPPPRPCTTQTLGWQVGALSCSGGAAGTASGNSVSAVDTDGPQVGSAVFACTNGSWGAPQAASCSTLPPAGCSAAVLPWTQNGQSCSAAVPATATGGVALAVDSEAPATGSAQFTCSNGSWSNATAAICQVPPPPPPATCARSLLSWTVAGTSCQAQAPGTASGLSVALADNVEPNLGSASFTCTAGQWGAPAQAMCTPPAPQRPCTAQSLGWQLGGLSCSASAQGTAAGNSVSAVDTEGPQVGSAVFACTNGTWGAAQAASCTTLPPAGCSAAVLPWTQAGQSCSAAVPAATSGSAALAVDSQAPATGSAQFTCSNGSWGAPATATCAIPPPRDCAAQTLNWSANGQLCQALTQSAPTGRAVLLQDLLAPSYGSARFTCSDGLWLPASQTEPQCGILAQTPSRTMPRSPWRPPQTLPWQGP